MVLANFFHISRLGLKTAFCNRPTLFSGYGWAARKGLTQPIFFHGPIGIGPCFAFYLFVVTEGVDGLHQLPQRGHGRTPADAERRTADFAVLALHLIDEADYLVTTRRGAIRSMPEPEQVLALL